LRNLFYSVNALEEINKVKPDAVLEFLAKIDCKIHLYIVLQKIAAEAGMQFNKHTTSQVGTISAWSGICQIILNVLKGYFTQKLCIKGIMMMYRMY